MLSSILLVASILALTALHLYLAPFTKVEESFNIQAIHDIITHGVPTRNVTEQLQANYDHVTFPGSVPRTFVGALILSGIAKPFVPFFSNSFHVQLLVRGILGLMNASALISFGNAVGKLFGKTAGIWYLALQATQFHILYYASRPLPNMFALSFTTVAFRSYLLALYEPNPETKSKHFRLCLYLLTISGIIFRAEIAVLLATITAYSFLFKGASLTKSIIPAGIAGVLLGLGLTIPIDSFFWQKFPLWPEFTAFYYNTIEGHSSEWGVSPWYFYFANAIPRLLFNPLSTIILIPTALLNPSTRPRSLDVLLPHLAFIGLYSILPHKEWRFIIYSIPPLTSVAAAGASWIWTRRTKSFIYGLVSLLLVGSVLASAGASFLMLLISSQNYPGGAAVLRLPHIVPQNQSTVRIHLDNLACQSGATRFLEYRGDWRSPSDPPVLERGVTNWVYDKTEDQDLLLTPEFWIDFDYAVVEKKERAIGKWEVVDTVEAFAGVRLLGPGEESRLMKREKEDGEQGMVVKVHNKVEGLARPLLKGRWAEVRMEERLSILKQQPLDYVEPHVA